VRKAGLSTLVIADGFSCKEQIEQETNRRGLHLAEVISMAMKNRSNGMAGMYPESASTQARLDQTRRSMWRAGVIAAAAIGVTVGMLWVRKRAA